MKTQEINFNGFKMNGFLMLVIHILIMPLIGFAIIKYMIPVALVPSVILVIILGLVWSVMFGGYFLLEPNEARAMVFFGKYEGTFKETGFFYVNPFYVKKKLSLRARNLDVEPIKVNDKIGNPVLIGLVLVWRLKDTYKAMFEIDSQTMASSGGSTAGMPGQAVASRMRAFEKFVMIQSDAALRQVAGQYAYDDNEADKNELTLRGGGEEINNQLEKQLNERLEMAGMEVIEARLNYLAYAPEIAAVMLRRQQASAIISAREKIVEGAVSMVKMALDQLKEKAIVDLDEEKKAAMVSNLLVVLCANEDAQPIVNAGTLNH